MVGLQKFYKVIPEKKTNPLWITGVSYGEIYVTYLALQIREHNLLIEMDKNFIDTIVLRALSLAMKATDI